MNCIRFLHIPKTAGTSFFHCLAGQYPGQHVFLADNWRRDVAANSQLTDAERSRITLVGGHAPRITGGPNIDALPTITLLRDPVSRVVSFCHHVWQGKSPYLLSKFPPGRFDLYDFLHSGDQQLENMQTRMLIGERCFALPNRPPRELARAAVEALTHNIKCFGVVERLADSMALFGRTLKWDTIPKLPHLNTRADTDALSFSPELIARIRRLNAIDIAVYKAATRIFVERVNRLSYKFAVSPRQVNRQTTRRSAMPVSA